MDTQPHDRQEQPDAPSAGDPVCWLERVCDGCGALSDGPPEPVCPRCGAARG